MTKYLVLALRKETFQQSAGKEHRAYLARLGREGKLEMSGSFGDKSGGAYLLNAESLEAAEALAFSDPLHITGSSELTVYEWDLK